MKRIEKNIVSSEVFYELSEKEFKEIKAEARAAGRKDVAEYIFYALSNYVYELNIGGVDSFIHELIPFLKRKSDGIRNNGVYDFFEWCKRREEDEI